MREGKEEKKERNGKILQFTTETQRGRKEKRKSMIKDKRKTETMIISG